MVLNEREETLTTVTVYDLMNNNFYIPDYQRGYRWTELEVNKLLADLEDFFNCNTDGSAFYCMQPLVVFFNEDKNAWEVIDGQQRLTTMYLILNQQKSLLKKKYPEKNLFNISYQSRPDSQQYLENIDDEKKEDNIDYYHIYNASEVIEKFFEKLALKSGEFVNAIVSANSGNADSAEKKPSVKFIWYDVTEEIKSKHISPEEKFSDLNIGKIGLTNAELIKALFLNNVGSDESEALRIASEWDNIEHALQDDSFWAFIYGKDDNRYVTRIEFLFDIIKGKATTEQNDYYTFDEYSKDINSSENNSSKKDKVKELWKEVSDKYNLFKGWYDDRKFYHIIGYLRYKKRDIESIENIYYDQKISDKEAFYSSLKEEALIDFKDTEIRELNYHEYKDYKTIYDILVLFNILSIVDCEKNNVRFSFDRFYKHLYDIEHVKSQTPKDLEGEGRKDWIVCNLEYFSGIDFNYCELDSSGNKVYKYQESFELFKEDISKAPNRNVKITNEYTVGDICEQLLQLFNEKSDITESEIYKILFNSFFKQNNDFKYEDNIGNLVLLDQGTNRGYKNAFYPVKRKWIYRREQEGFYILPCTQNVFSKNYSSMIFDLMNWNNDDAEAYMAEIERVIIDEQI